MVLSLAKPGFSAVAHIEGEESLYMRLASMGITEGALLNVIMNERSRPLIVESGGSTYAIAREIAGAIELEEAL